MTASSGPQTTPPYRRREPEHTLLYRVVAAELDALDRALAAASPYGRGLAPHVRRELDGFLECGLLYKGFARVLCRRCRTEHLVAWSCKGRGVCPSCTTRRMHDTAAHLCDRVLPHVPMRQWVVTFPRRVRYHLAAEPKLATEALGLVLRTIFAWQRRRARRLGEKPSRAHSNGAVTAVQRFNSSLELSLHFHSLIPDGVFVSDGAAGPDVRPRFIALAEPSDEEIAALLDTIIRCVVAMLRRRGRLDEDVDGGDDDPQLLLAARPAGVALAPSEDPLPPRCARKDGFSLHAGIAVHKNDRAGLERLARYCLRPPLCQGRLQEAPDGRLLYTMKRRFSDGRHVLCFEPRDFVLRLCALIPPRGFHMVRYAGTFAAHARGRYALTGRGMRDRPAPTPAPPPATSVCEAQAEQSAPGVPGGAAAPPAPPSSSPACSSKDAVPPADWASPIAVPPADWASPIALGDDLTRPRRLEWSVLMRRAFGVDVLCCPNCDARMEIIAIVDGVP